MTDLTPSTRPKGSAYDLTSMMRTFQRRNDKSYKAAGNALKNLRDTQSAVNDIVIALELLLYLRENDDAGCKRAVTMPAAIVGACFSHAILLYIRATEAGGDRRNLKLKSRLSDRLKVVHGRLDDLRNKAIAHLDNDRPYGSKSFTEQVLVLVHDGDGAHRIQLADRRVTYQTEIEEDLAALLDTAFQLCKEELDERQADVARLISKLSENDPQIALMIEKHPFDAMSFFGDLDQAEGFLEHGNQVVAPKHPAVFFEGWPDPIS